MRHRLFDGTGAMLYGARWNSPGRRVIYAAETYSGALLEVLVHASGRVPRSQGYVTIEILEGAGVEVVGPEDVPGWDAADSESARRYGDRWFDERRSLALVVPSVVTRVESNVLINQDHPEFRLVRASEPRPVLWDQRLWSRV